MLVPSNSLANVGNILSYFKKPVSECELGSTPSGHVTTPIGAIYSIYVCMNILKIANILVLLVYAK